MAGRGSNIIEICWLGLSNASNGNIPGNSVVILVRYFFSLKRLHAGSSAAAVIGPHHITAVTPQGMIRAYQNIGVVPCEVFRPSRCIRSNQLHLPRYFVKFTLCSSRKNAFIDSMLEKTLFAPLMYWLASIYTLSISTRHLPEQNMCKHVNKLKRDPARRHTNAMPAVSCIIISILNISTYRKAQTFER